MELAENHLKTEAYTMNSIAEIFDNSKQLLDSIENFFDKYIGRPLLRKCGVIKMVDDIFVNSGMTYFDNPISRLLGDLKQDRKSVV